MSEPEIWANHQGCESLDYDSEAYSSAQKYDYEVVTEEMMLLFGGDYTSSDIAIGLSLFAICSESAEG